MFAAVFALFILTAATGGSGADSFTAILPLHVGGGGECYVHVYHKSRVRTHHKSHTGVK